MASLRDRARELGRRLRPREAEHEQPLAEDRRAEPCAEDGHVPPVADDERAPPVAGHAPTWSPPAGDGPAAGQEEQVRRLRAELAAELERLAGRPGRSSGPPS